MNVVFTTVTKKYFTPLNKSVLTNSLISLMIEFQLLDAIEGLLLRRIQDTLDLVDIEKEIESHLSELDDMTNPNPPEDDMDLKVNSLGVEYYDDIVF